MDTRHHKSTPLPTRRRFSTIPSVDLRSTTPQRTKANPSRTMWPVVDKAYAYVTSLLQLRFVMSGPEDRVRSRIYIGLLSSWQAVRILRASAFAAPRNHTVEADSFT